MAKNITANKKMIKLLKKAQFGLVTAASVFTLAGCANNNNKVVEEPIPVETELPEAKPEEENKNIIIVEPQIVYEKDGSISYYAPEGFVLRQDENGEYYCEKEVTDEYQPTSNQQAEDSMIEEYIALKAREMDGYSITSMVDGVEVKNFMYSPTNDIYDIRLDYAAKIADAKTKAEADQLFNEGKRAFEKAVYQNRLDYEKAKTNYEAKRRDVVDDYTRFSGFDFYRNDGQDISDLEQCGGMYEFDNKVVIANSYHLVVWYKDTGASLIISPEPNHTVPGIIKVGNVGTYYEYDKSYMEKILKDYQDRGIKTISKEELESHGCYFSLDFSQPVIRL